VRPWIAGAGGQVDPDEHRRDGHRRVRQDGRCDRVRAQVLVAVGLQLMSEVDHQGALACDLQRGVDGAVSRGLDPGVGAKRCQEFVEPDGVLLDQLLGAEPQRLCLPMDLAGAGPGFRAHGDLLQQCGRRRQGCGRRGTTRRRGRARRDLAQEIAKPGARIRFRTRQSHPFAWS